MSDEKHNTFRADDAVKCYMGCNWLKLKGHTVEKREFAEGDGLGNVEKHGTPRSVTRGAHSAIPRNRAESLAFHSSNRTERRAWDLASLLPMHVAIAFFAHCYRPQPMR